MGSSVAVWSRDHKLAAASVVIGLVAVVISAGQWITDVYAVMATPHNVPAIGSSTASATTTPPVPPSTTSRPASRRAEPDIPMPGPTPPAVSRWSMLYSDKLIDVEVPRWCGQTWVDLEPGHARYIEQGVDLPRGSDLVHHGCDFALKPTGGAFLGKVPAGAVTAETCAGYARSRSFASLPSGEITTDTVLCAITASNVIAWIRFSYVGDPCVDDGTGARCKPTLGLEVTAWTNSDP